MLSKVYYHKKNRRWLTIPCCGVLLLIMLHLIIGWFTKISIHQSLTQDIRSFGEDFEISQAERISRLLPSLPIDFWNRHKINKSKMHYKNSLCAPFPSIFDVKYSNLYWQYLKASKYSFQLYKAFYDTRQINDLKKSVQIIAMIDFKIENMKTYCQFWFEGSTEPLIVETFRYTYIWVKEWGRYQPGEYSPYLITCELPESQTEPPSCVSLVEKPCDKAANLLRVIFEPPTRKEEFAVCVKGLDFLDIDLSARIVEWLEFLHLMGVSKVFFYNLQAHPKIEKVLNHYQSLGRIDVTRITLPEGQPNLPILQHQYLEVHYEQKGLDELIHYNDCFYRNIYSYKFIVLLDIDEVILPIKDPNWTMLMKRVLKKAKDNVFASYNVRNVFFLDDMEPPNNYSGIPEYMHMLRHVHRSRDFSPPFYFVKSFFDPETVLTVHNHLPFAFSSKRMHSYSIENIDAQLNHYRRTCAYGIDCNPNNRNVTEDTQMWKYADVLMSRTRNVLEYLDLI